MERMDLNRDWKLHEAPLYWNASYLPSVKRFQEDWYSCDLPADVRMPLIERGIIRDPVLADYCLESEWIEKRSWWFVKEFQCSEELYEKDVLELVMEAMDTESDVFVNGQLIGHHASVHEPFVFSIKNYILPGKNEIAARVSTGLEKVTEEQLSELNWAVCREDDNGGKYRSDYRRAFVRRPQYTVGWDWGPRVVTCGITGEVYIGAYREIAVREVCLGTESLGDAAVLKAVVNIENLDIQATKTGKLSLTLYYEGELCAEAGRKDLLLTSGFNYVELTLEVKDPKLWWPNGYGGQPLYEVRVRAETGESGDSYPEFRIGIRTIELDTSVMEGEDRWFRFLVNGEAIFCKGGNWIPNDSIYARTTDEKIGKLLEEAVTGNFNMLRVWGGGEPNGDEAGDVHRWHNGFMSKKMSDRIEPENYDGVNSKFVSEYGYVGPCCMDSIKEYMADNPLERGSGAWEMHSNVFEKDTVYAGIEKQYLDHPRTLDMEDYVLYGGMVHSLMLGYSLEAIRFKESCGGALFWMYNDTWGEIGWTVIDYYLRRKISYYGVKRAFAPVKCSIRRVHGKVVLQGLNDTAENVTIEAEYGYVSFDGKRRKTQNLTLELKPRSRSYLREDILPMEEYETGSIMLIPRKGEVDGTMLRTREIRNLKFASLVESREIRRGNGEIVLSVTSGGYAHGVYVDGNYQCSDNYFDLLPGETKIITVKAPDGEKLEIKQVR